MVQYWWLRYSWTIKVAWVGCCSRYYVQYGRLCSLFFELYNRQVIRVRRTMNTCLRCNTNVKRSEGRRQDVHTPDTRPWRKNSLLIKIHSPRLWGFPRYTIFRLRTPYNKHLILISVHSESRRQPEGRARQTRATLWQAAGTLMACTFSMVSHEKMWLNWAKNHQTKAGQHLDKSLK